MEQLKKEIKEAIKLGLGSGIVLTIGLGIPCLIILLSIRLFG